MKPVISILFLIISFTSRSQIQIGGRIGTGFANLQNIDEKTDSYTWRQGLYSGIFLNWKLNPTLLIQPEVNFSSEGGRKKEIQQVPVGTFTIPGTTSAQPIYANLNTATIIHYIEVPILAKVTLGNKIKYYMCFGPYVSFLADAKRKASGNSIVYLDKAGNSILKQDDPLDPNVSSDFNYETSIRDKIKNTNFGFIAGCGFEFSKGPGAIFVESRLKLGMTNIDAYPALDGKYQATCISFSAGYLIKLKKLNL